MPKGALDVDSGNTTSASGARLRLTRISKRRRSMSAVSALEIRNRYGPTERGKTPSFFTITVAGMFAANRGCGVSLTVAFPLRQVFEAWLSDIGRRLSYP